MTLDIRRREFTTLLGGTAAMSSSFWPRVARAQGERVRRVGVLASRVETDPFQKANLAALREELAKLGWTEGRNLQLDVRFGAGEPSRIRAYAAELVSLAPDVIVTVITAATTAVKELTQIIPIVFTSGGDPVASGVVQSLARPEGNATGFSGMSEPSIAGKWLELLKEAAPQLSRVAIVFDPGLASAVAQAYLSTIEGAALRLAPQTMKMPVRDAIEIVRSIDAFAAEPNGGLIMLPPPLQASNLEIFMRLAVQHRLPTMHNGRDSTIAGGLVSYGPIIVDQYRRVAGYVDRLLRGAKVSELPVQFPTKFELVVNLKTAKAIGLAIPEAFLLRADEVIE